MFARADAGQHQDLRRVEGAAGQDDLAFSVKGHRLSRSMSAGHFWIGAIQMRAVQGGHAHRAVAIKQDASDQRVISDVQSAGMRGLGGQNALAGAVSASIIDGDRDEAHAFAPFGHEPPVVRIIGQQHIFRRAERRPAFRLHRADDVQEPRFASRQFGVCAGRLQPAVEPVATGVAGSRRTVWVWILAVPGLQPLEPLPHRLCAPIRIAGQLRQMIPVGVMRIDGDQGADRRRSAQGRAAGIEHAVPFRDELAIALLLRVISIMTHEEVPAHFGVFAGSSLHDRHIVVGTPVVAPGLDQQDGMPRLDQIGGQRPPACAGADDDEVVHGVGHHRLRVQASSCSRRTIASAPVGRTVR